MVGVVSWDLVWFFWRGVDVEFGVGGWRLRLRWWCYW